MKKETRGWLNKAEEDLDTAKFNLNGGKYSFAIFLCQQSIEKALKAMQIEKLNKFDKIHDLTRLAKSISAPAEIINFCEDISPYYTITRYPDIGESLNKTDAFSKLKKSEKVITWVKQNLNL